VCTCPSAVDVDIDGGEPRIGRNDAAAQLDGESYWRRDSRVRVGDGGVLEQFLVLFGEYRGTARASTAHRP
jgi:hypothetical protein